MAIKSRDGVDMISANREETEAGLVDTYIVKLRGYAKCHHPVTYSSVYKCVNCIGLNRLT